LETLTNRVDALEAKINAMNLKISETCTNMADVIAYVDANMADMKDFLAEVVKKLPNPKRLEVRGSNSVLYNLSLSLVDCWYLKEDFDLTFRMLSHWIRISYCFS
jgi:cellulose synthase/poly-beta-1,6-N-acetylglucosamine synthase-like glycosyltransferase